MRRESHNLLLAAAFAVVASIAGCGGGQASSSSTATPVAKAQPRPTPVKASPAPVVVNPSVVIARVGGYAITGAMYNHWLSAEVKSEPSSDKIVPVPPDFTACVEYLEKKPSQSPTGAELQPSTTLKAACRQQYQALREQALGRLISAEWVIHGVAEAGGRVTRPQIEERLEQSIRREFPKPAQFQAFLATSGRTKADLEREMHALLAEEAIRSTIKAKARRITQTQIASYYAEHERQFAVPERRDLKIIRTHTKAGALKVRREIESGKSFAEVAHGISLPQPIYSKEGLVLGLKPLAYSEPVLSDAIFAAKPNVLKGPVKISLGYYIFEVKGFKHGFQRSLADVQSSLRKKLPEEHEKQALSSFIKRWRAKWTSKTSCSPGYVIQKCKQFKPSATTPKQDLLTLN